MSVTDFWFIRVALEGLGFKDIFKNNAWDIFYVNIHYFHFRSLSDFQLIKVGKNSYKCNPFTGANLCWWKHILKSAIFSQIKDITSLDYCLCWTTFFFLNSPCIYINLFILYLVRKHLKITNLRIFDHFLNNLCICIHIHAYSEFMIFETEVSWPKGDKSLFVTLPLIVFQLMSTLL